MSDRRHSSGHYHIECEDDVYVNEESLKTAIKKAQSKNPISAHWVCSFGCGMPHKLTLPEQTALRGAFPNIKFIEA